MRRAETLIIICALGFYVWFIAHFGPGQILGYVRLAGWGLALTVLLEALARLMNTLGWRMTIEDYPKSLGPGELFVARVSGEAIDYVTPSAQLGGEVVMAMMVRHKLKMAAGLASSIVAALTEAVGQIAFVVLALAVSIRLVPESEKLFWPIIGGFAIAVGLAGGLFIIQKKRPFSWLLRAAARFDFTRVSGSGIKEAAAEADAMLLDLFAHHRLRLLLSGLCFLVAWSLGPIEIYILLRLLGHPASLQIALLVEAVGLLIERATFLIPAKLVSQEGGKALILALLGYPPGAGFVVGFLRRVKELIWVLLGLLGLTIHRMVVEGGPREPVEPAATAEPAVEISRVQSERSA